MNQTFLLITVERIAAGARYNRNVTISPQGFQCVVIYCSVGSFCDDSDKPSSLFKWKEYRGVDTRKGARLTS